MQREVQWFIAEMVSGDLLEKEEAIQLNTDLGGEVDLEKYAQTILEAMESQCSESEADAMFEQIQKIAEHAQEQAATGNIPEMFAGKETPPAQPEVSKIPQQPLQPVPLPVKLPETAEKKLPGIPGLPKTPSSSLPHAAPAQAISAQKPPVSLPKTPPTLPKTPPSLPKPSTASAVQPAQPVPSSDTSADAPQSIADAEEQHLTPAFAPPMNYGMLDTSAYFDALGCYKGPRTEKGLPSLAGVDEMPDEQVAALMKALLTELRTYGASDLHISSSAKPFIRRSLELERIEDVIITPAAAERLNFCMLTPEQVLRFRKDQDMNFALEIGKDRFRAALIVQKDGISGSYRLVPSKIPSLAELGFLPKDVQTLERLMDYPNGLVLVTGPIGSGKTTTLASLVDVANSRREDHIIMVEDPIEILQHSKKCQITQRQVVTHTKSYSSALKGALREDPDIIVIGEMHDLETIENAITAAETGHLVIGTLHTRDAANTMNRILDVFPPNQQPQIRSMTAGSLRGVVCQRLLKGTNGKLTIAYEILVNNISVANVISEGKIFQLRGYMQIGSKSGMCTIDQTLFEKYKAGAISYETALEGMTDKSIIDMIKREKAISEAKKLAAAMPHDKGKKK